MTPHKMFIKLRKRLGLSQEEACKRCKVSLRSLRYFESGKRKRVTLGYLHRRINDSNQRNCRSCVSEV